MRNYIWFRDIKKGFMNNPVEKGVKVGNRQFIEEKYCHIH